MKLSTQYYNEYLFGELKGMSLYDFIKKIQTDTIQEACQACADNADADVTFQGWLAEESLKSGEPFEEGEDYEVYVIESSILSVAEKLIKELE